MSVHAPGIPHPRIAQRRSAVKAEATRAGERLRRRLLWSSLLLGLLILCGFLATRSELLDVDEIRVNGAHYTPSVDVLSAAGIARGEPLLGLDLAQARTRIAQLPWVEQVYSSRSWQGSVSFTISERAAVAALSMPGAWVTVDAGGRILSVAPELQPGVTAVEGLSLSAAAPGGWLDRDHLAAVSVAGALYEPVRSAVRAVVATPQGFVLDLHAPGRVELGDERDLTSKLVAVHTLLEQVSLRCLDRLDVRAASTPVLTRSPGCL